MALPNLTRDQAVERAALVTVDSYRIILDLTDGGGKPGEHTFRSVTTVEFDALAGAGAVRSTTDDMLKEHPDAKLAILYQNDDFGKDYPAGVKDVLGDRWTPLVIRELMMGASGFNEIHRGIPRVSRTLLAEHQLPSRKQG